MGLIARRRIIRGVCAGNITCRALRDEQNANFSVRRVQQVLSECPKLHYGKRKGAPPLTEKHKKKRMEFAIKNIDLGERWKDIIFSDEKV